MKIAVVAPLSPPLLPAQPCGNHAIAVDLARFLSARGHRTRLYCAEGSDVPGVDVATVPVDAADPGGLHVAFTKLFRKLRGWRPEAVTQHASDIAAIRMAERLPVVHTLHVPPADPELVQVLRAGTTAVATVSESCRRAWVEAGVERCAVLRNGVPDFLGGVAESLIAHLDHNDLGPFALTAGRIAPEKGIDVAVRAARRAGLSLRVVGSPWDTAYFEGKVRPLLEEGELVPPVTRAELARVMTAAEAVVLPVQWDEPFGLVAAEAQIAGCPVVGYRRGALPEIVEDGRGGFLVDPGDEDALVEALGRVSSLDRLAIRRRALARLAITPMLDAYEAALSAVARPAAR